MKQKVTLKILSEILNVSISTVSKSLSDSGDISVSTKKRVLKMAKHYNYKPNPMASSLKTNRTRIIGVVIPEIYSHFFAEVLLGIENEVRKQGYQVIIIFSSNSFKKETNAMDLFLNGFVDGVILSLATETFFKDDFSHLQSAIDNKLPLVLFDRTTDKIECDKIVIDDYEITVKATNSLIKQGCKNIVFYSNLDKIGVDKMRIEGYKHSITTHSNYTNEGVVLSLSDSGTIKTLFSNYLDNNVVDAIIASDELASINILNVAKTKGYKIPKDISVIGFTDGLLSINAAPSLTSVNQKAIQMGSDSVKTLINRINNNNAPITTQTLNAFLTERESTKKSL
ncbi:MAG: LacI family transcriptional regulator [Flavobacteriaceae bacterium]|nr:MAG: LacI family transcriptional regulator [Flavobacteriaceae bacterium]